MGHPRKNSRRRINVDGTVYRYHVSPDDGYIVLLVRSEAARGQWLRVRFRYDEVWASNGDGSYSAVTGHRLILPRVARLAILDGLRRGWDPSAQRPHLFPMFEGDGLLAPEEWPRSSLRDPAGDEG